MYIDIRGTTLPWNDLIDEVGSDLGHTSAEA